MEPSIIHSLIGNLGLHGDFSTNAPYSTATKQRNKLKKGIQIVININGVPTEKRVSTKPNLTATYKHGYHGVFLDNGQVYFGKLRRWPDGAQFVVLTKAYYLTDINQAAVLNVDLIKLGSEIHTPKDELHINIRHILFWQKLEDKGPIVTAILKSSGK